MRSITTSTKPSVPFFASASRCAWATRFAATNPSHHTSNMLKITGYADRISAHPGETIHLMVNCEYPSYTLETVRVVQGDTSPAAPALNLQPVDGVRHELPGRAQHIVAGSFGLVEGLPVWASDGSLGFQAFIYPT